MKPKDFARGLQKLAKDHKDDDITVFDTDLFKVFSESADMIIALDNQLKDAQDKLAEVQVWFEAYSREQESAKLDKEIEVPDLKKEEEPKFKLPWDGTRRDLDEEGE